MSSECNSVSLDELGVLRVRGAHVVSFLQGQVSNDVALLGPGRSLLAGYHNPQGRVIALLRLVQAAADDVLAILPRELAAPTASRLAKFILRAKVSVADESAGWRVTGVVAPESPAERAPPFTGALPQALNATARSGDSIAVRIGAQPARWLLVSGAGASANAPVAVAGCAPMPLERWGALAVAAGEPQVCAATSEEFVAQMLNLDLLGAIAFDKGCYTGQEVIARAHYRGRVKRRLQRFVTNAPLQLQPGDAGALSDGRAFKVVSAVALADRRCEFLAVAPFAGEDCAAGRPQPGAERARVIDAQQLPLPYSLPP
ncbi:MAG: folate-binding protein YgfZ [Gammaproteobacteria bacterium]|nr:MAG: folate-binding protein YgfZ [Gammaproteobacteria bacterium]TLY88264.1 MAG: folate-binding protein YgfZ [Gammaproteobacteria bacterium]